MSIDPNILNPIVSITVLILMMSFETFRPSRPWTVPRKKRLLFHASLSIFNGALLFFLTTAPLLFWTDLVHSKGWGLVHLLGLKGPLEIFISIVVLDMFDYWWHRLNHEISFLWRFHKVHHSDTHVDTTTALRFHPGELLISSLIVKTTWLLIWGPSLLAFALFEACVTIASEFHHSNIDLNDKIETPLRKIIVTPRFHASHHTQSKRTLDANYSAIFIFWDKIFGTYREPDYKEMETMGFAKGRDKELSFTTAMKAPFSSVY